MYILGISCFYHDSSATLLKDGKIVAAAAEERFTRKKHDTSFPINSIKFCLESQNITIQEINFIGFYEKPMIKFERFLYQNLEYFPKSYKIFLKYLPSWINEKLRFIRIIRKKINYKKNIFFVEHHLSHAASFLVSPFKKAAILTIDGVGEWTTTTYGTGEGNNIKLIKEIKFPNSLGLFYSSITAYLGFSVNNSEYKVMGLSAYGDMNKETNIYYQKLKKIIDLKEDGSYRFDMNYFAYSYADKMPSKKFCELLEGSVRNKDEEITQRHKDIAAALQLITEEILIKILNNVYQITKCENIVISGGVALNSCFNGKVLKKTPFKRVWIQPDPGDGGTSLGVAFYVYNAILKNKRNYVLNDIYLGQKFSKKEIKQFLDKNKIKYSEFKDENELIKKTAELIYNNNVVGWFQGRFEWGPRALGNRSILANPTNKKMKETLNLKVKHREIFRPFAPVVCEEDVYTYFECDKPLPIPTNFMLMVYNIRKKWKDKIPSVVHIDNSCRLQVINNKQNTLYFKLVKEFGKLSGVPILINTSFNIRGEPIVCTPEDAYNCMMGTEIDFLILENFLIKREDNPKDTWDSENYARD